MFHSIGNTPSQPFGWAFGTWKKDAGLGGKDAGGTRVEDRLMALSRTRSTDVQFQIQTDEGDTVTLTLHRETDVTMLRYRSRTSGEDGRGKSGLDLRSVTQSQEIGIQVEGMLSDEERADIDALVARVVAALPATLNGDGDLGALAASTSGDEFESLAGYSLNVSRTQTLDMIAMRLREWHRATTEPVDPPVAPEPVVTAELPVAESPANVLPICLAPVEVVA